MGNKKALLVVDVQVDFCEGGAMGVKGGNEVAQAVADLLRSPRRADQYDIVVFSRDWHDPDTDNGGHFHETPDFKDTWPAHCVQGTNGADFHPAVDPLYRDQTISKGMDAPAYSAFEGVTDDGDTLLDYLTDHEIGDVDVVGIAYDYCVKATALDAAKYGFQTRVLADYTAAVDPSNEAVNAEFAKAGVREVI